MRIISRRSLREFVESLAGKKDQPAVKAALDAWFDEASRAKADYKDAMAEVEQLRGAKNGTAKGDRLDVLVTLIEAYEARHFPMDPPDPIEALKFRMSQQGLTRKDLEPLIGSRARVAEVMNRKRSLSIDMIRRLDPSDPWRRDGIALPFACSISLRLLPNLLNLHGRAPGAKQRLRVASSGHPCL